MTEELFPRTLTLKHVGGPTETVVTAATEDDIFAVHRSIGGDEYRRFWTVTHIPTGLAITNCCFSRPEAIKIVEQLRLIPWDWESNEHATFKLHLRTAAPHIRAKMNDIVLGVV
jgi:hypothetical protein